MAYNLKQTLNKEERLSPGHRMCAGCGATMLYEMYCASSRRRRSRYHLCNRMP